MVNINNATPRTDKTPYKVERANIRKFPGLRRSSVELFSSFVCICVYATLYELTRRNQKITIKFSVEL